MLMIMSAKIKRLRVPAIQELCKKRGLRPFCKQAGRQGLRKEEMIGRILLEEWTAMSGGAAGFPNEALWLEAWSIKRDHGLSSTDPLPLDSKSSLLKELPPCRGGGLNKLLRLDLRNNQFGEEGIEALAEAIQPHSNRLLPTFCDGRSHRGREVRLLS